VLEALLARDHSWAALRLERIRLEKRMLHGELVEIRERQPVTEALPDKDLALMSTDEVAEKFDTISDLNGYRARRTGGLERQGQLPDRLTMPNDMALCADN